MALYDAVGTLENFRSFRHTCFDHLAADATCLTSGQVAVVALLKVYANLACCLLLELLKRLLSLLVCHFCFSFARCHRSYILC